MRFAFITVLSSLLIPFSAFASDAGTYRPGKAYHSVKANNPSDCASHCRGDAQCKGWNFIRPRQSVRTGVCEFNSEQATPVPSAMSESGSNESVRRSSQLVSNGTNTVRVQSADINKTPKSMTPASMTPTSSQMSASKPSSSSLLTPRTYGSTSQSTRQSVTSPTSRSVQTQSTQNPASAMKGQLAQSGVRSHQMMPQSMSQMPMGQPMSQGMGMPQRPAYQGAMAPRTFTQGYLSQNALGPQAMPQRQMPQFNRPQNPQMAQSGMHPQNQPQQGMRPQATPQQMMQQRAMQQQAFQQQGIRSPAMMNPAMRGQGMMPQQRQPYPGMQNPTMRAPQMQPRSKGLPLVGNLFSRNRAPSYPQMGQRPMMPNGMMPNGMGPNPMMQNRMMPNAMAQRQMPQNPMMAPQMRQPQMNAPQNYMQRPSQMPLRQPTMGQPPMGQAYPSAYQMDMARAAAAQTRAPQIPRAPQMSRAPMMGPSMNRAPQPTMMTRSAPSNSLYGSLHDDVRSSAPMMSQTPMGMGSNGSMPIVNSVPTQPIKSGYLGNLAGAPGYPPRL